MTISYFMSTLYGKQMDTFLSLSHQNSSINSKFSSYDTLSVVLYHVILHALDNMTTGNFYLFHYKLLGPLLYFTQ